MHDLDEPTIADPFVDEDDPLLPYDVWLDVLCLLHGTPRARHDDELAARGISQPRVDRASSHWVGVLSDELSRGDLARSRQFGARFAVLGRPAPDTAEVAEAPKTLVTGNVAAIPIGVLPFVPAPDVHTQTAQLAPASPPKAQPQPLPQHRGGDTEDVTAAVEELKKGPLPFRSK